VARVIDQVARGRKAWRISVGGEGLAGVRTGGGDADERKGWKHEETEDRRDGRE